MESPILDGHDLLHRPLPQHEHAPRPRRRWRRWAAFAALLVVLALGVLTVIAAGRVVGAMSTVKDAAARAETALQDGDFADADAALGEALGAIQSARSGLALVPFLRIVPWVGTQLRGLSYTLEAGEATMGALREAVAIVLEVQRVTEDAQSLVGITDGDVPYGELPTSARVALLDALHDAYPQLLTMQMKLSLARDDLGRLDTLRISAPLREAVAPFSDLVGELADAVDLLTPFAAALPELTGLGEDRQMLLLFANNTELRPAGGFLGVFGLAITRDGEVVGMTTDDVYNIDKYVADEGYQVAPPAPLATYLGTTKWYFRDSNWSPDFPTSVTTSIQLLRQEIAYAGVPVPEIHGAVMFTPTFVGRLLDFVGPVTIDGQTFTEDNIADKLEYEVEIGYVEDGIPPHQRKDVIARMTDVVVDRVLALPSSSWPSLFAILKEGFAQKELVLWSADEETQAVYVDAGWSGATLPAATDDVLMVVDANLAALKTDPVVERTIAYTVTPTAQGYQATAAITYTNNGTFTWKTTRYRTYTRVYAPLGSTLLSSSGTLVNDKILSPSGAEGEVTVADELGMTTFGAFTSIEPGTSRTLSFTYLLPASVGDAIENDVYELQVIKQIGAEDHELVLDLDFNRDIARATPAEDEDAWGDDVYHVETVLATDATFTVQW